MKNFNVLVLVTLMGLTSQSYAEPGFFVEGTLGRTKVDLGSTGSLSVNNKDTTFGLNAGYMFNDYVGIEGGYRDLGDASASATANFNGKLYGKALVGNGTLSFKGDGKGWTLGPRVNLPINNDFSLNARAGWFRWESDVSATVSAAFTLGGVAYAGNASASTNVKGTDTYYGIGGAYNINKQLAVGLNYNQYKLDTVKVDTWDVALKYRF